jgi:hypothetical protein
LNLTSRDLPFVTDSSRGIAAVGSAKLNGSKVSIILNELPPIGRAEADARGRPQTKRRGSTKIRTVGVRSSYLSSASATVSTHTFSDLPGLASQYPRCIP